MAEAGSAECTPIGSMTTETEAATHQGRKVGTVVLWLNHRGIGFITPDGEETVVGRDLLVHHAQIKQNSGTGGTGGSTFKSLEVGSRVEYDTAVDPKNPDKLIAVNVTGIGGVDCQRRTTTRFLGGGRKHRKPTFPVYVDNLGGDGGNNGAAAASWRTVKDWFRRVGYVDWVDVKGGAGVVHYASERDARRAVETLDGYDLDGSVIAVRLEGERTTEG